MDRSREIRKGLKKTNKYLLSHHEHQNYDRCYTLSFRGSRLHLCSRCLGIYTGMVAGLILSHLGTVLPVALILVLPFPTVVEKFSTSIKNFNGYNSLRTIFGVFLGTAYIQAVFRVLANPFQTLLVGAGIFYALLALGLIYLQRN